VLDEIRAFQAILNQPISLGLLVKGGKGPPGPPGKSGGKGTMGDQGPVGENGSPGLEGRFGKAGTSGAPGEPGLPGYEKVYDAVNYANKRRNVDYVNQGKSDTNTDKTDYNTDQSLPKVTRMVCEGERLWMGCKQEEKINITNAFWGRDDFITCSEGAPSNRSIRQYSLDNNDHVFMKVRDICNWRPTCEFYATRSFLDDVTDTQVYKYLRVVFECVPKGTTRKKKLSGTISAWWSR
jgi:hypothetical protein